MPLIRGGVRPDVYVIILESFSSQLFPSVGGEEVALRLDSIAREGLMFTNFYANSFRTDRGLVSIMSGYPGQPNTSIMKFVSKTENLPSFPRRMKEEGGYSSTYYYGGDANFTNMKAYLVNAGFDRIISDVDFPVSKRLSKWGAHDDEVFSMAIGELAPYEADKPKLKVIQTSSSHEPFEVPYDDKGRFPDIRARAFAYADSCAADFINALHDGKEWNNSLVVIVPDHYGAYPDTDDPLARHKVPLIITGGALAYRGTDNTAGSQIDIASTLLGALRLPHDDFSFSRNLLNPCTTHFAFFADPSLIGMVTESDTTIYNLDSDKIVPLYGASARNEDSAKAFLQLLYDDLSKTMTEYILNLDTEIFLWLNSFHALYWDVFMKMSTSKIIWVPMYVALVIALWRTGGWRTMVVMVVGAVLAVTLADQVTASLLRPMFERLRPANLDNPISAMVHIVNDYRGGRYGFPSCHAANTFAVVSLMSLFFYRWRFTLFIIMWALLNCYSRLYLGVHYPGDLIAGILVGSICGGVVFLVASAVMNYWKGCKKPGYIPPKRKLTINGRIIYYRPLDLVLLDRFPDHLFNRTLLRSPLQIITLIT